MQNSTVLCEFEVGSQKYNLNNTSYDYSEITLCGLIGIEYMEMC